MASNKEDIRFAFQRKRNAAEIVLREDAEDTLVRLAEIDFTRKTLISKTLRPTLKNFENEQLRHASGEGTCCTTQSCTFYKRSFRASRESKKLICTSKIIHRDILL